MSKQDPLEVSLPEEPAVDVGGGINAFADRTDLKPGAHEMKDAEYFSLMAINSSTLRKFSKPNTPAHARREIFSPKPPTAAMNLGRAYHALILSQPEFGEWRMIPPGKDRRCVEAKRAAADGYQTLRDVELARLMGMQAALMEHKRAKEYLSAFGAQRELTLIWYEVVTVDGESIRVPCKGRIDLRVKIEDVRYIADFKSCMSAAPETFAWSVARYGYNEQAAWYQRGHEAVFYEWPEFVIIPQEKTAPFLPATYKLDEQSLRQGRGACEQNLQTLLRCLRDGVWPGYDEGLPELRLPFSAVDPAFEPMQHAAAQATEEGDADDEDDDGAPAPN